MTHYGIQGQICDSDFGDNEAVVACHMAGYDTGLSFCCGSFPGRQWDEVMWMGDISCTGSEQTLTECSVQTLWSVTANTCDLTGSIAIACFNNINDDICKCIHAFILTS